MKKGTIFILLCVLTQLLVAQTEIIAHRGHWKPEGSAQNSISALKMPHPSMCMVRSGYLMSRDGVPMCNHDDSIYYEGKKISVQDTDAEILRK